MLYFSAQHMGQEWEEMNSLQLRSWFRFYLSSKSGCLTLCDVGINIALLYNYMRQHIQSREWLDICCLLLPVLTRPRAFLALGAVESILHCILESILHGIFLLCSLSDITQRILTNFSAICSSKWRQELMTLKLTWPLLSCEGTTTLCNCHIVWECVN